MKHLLLMVFLLKELIEASPYKCGQKEIRNEKYGKVELQVNCEYLSKDGMISVLEYKGEFQNGFQIDYDSLWRKRDSSFFINGKENGTSLFWDTIGNIVGRETHQNGKTIGKQEHYFSPNHPSLVKNYNADGKADGPWDVWWENGNKKSEFIAKNGHIISGTEYYPSGKPRVQYVSKYEPKLKSVLLRKRINCESWAPNGKPAGKVVNGNGEWLLFPAEKDSTEYAVFREVYKDSLLVKGEKLDSAQIAPWLNH